MTLRRLRCSAETKKIIKLLVSDQNYKNMADNTNIWDEVDFTGELDEVDLVREDYEEGDLNPYSNIE
jgi:hypothetical protein